MIVILVVLNLQQMKGSSHLFFIDNFLVLWDFHGSKPGWEEFDVHDLGPSVSGDVHDHVREDKFKVGCFS